VLGGVRACSSTRNVFRDVFVVLVGCSAPFLQKVHALCMFCMWGVWLGGTLRSENNSVPVFVVGVGVRHAVGS
jgi:hypothetical protein